MTIDAVLAARAAILERAATPGTGASAPAPGFGAMLEAALRKPIASSDAAEVASTGYENGTTDDIAGVELARTEATIDFQTAVQVRNRLLSAYHDIMNMAG